MKYGYARVSSSGQDLTIQVEALTAAGCETIGQEKVSGTSVQGRDELKTLLDFVREGDELASTVTLSPTLNAFPSAVVESITTSLLFVGGCPSIISHCDA